MIIFEAEIAEDVTFESCQQELVKIKDIISKKYNVNLGKQEGNNNNRSGYAAKLNGGGWIALLVEEKRNDKGYIMSMAIKCTENFSDSNFFAFHAYEEVEKKVKAEWESNRPRLNISKDEGADVL